MIGISTSWLSSKVDEPSQIIAQIAAVGAEAIELEYRISSLAYSKIVPLLEKYQMTVLSVHNFFPIPPMLNRGSGDAFLFTSDDKEERDLAVEYTKTTVQQASELEARVAILHLGGIPLKTDLDRLYEFYDQGQYESEEAILLKKHLTEERKDKARVYLDRVLLCLDRLLPLAEKLEVTIGIENRYHYHEIPSYHELGQIFKEFKGAPIAYWHDVGHAHNLESLGLGGDQGFLDTYAAEMAGIHLHDAKGREDHFAPGSGDLEFSQIKPHLRPWTIKIIEVHSKVSSNQLSRSLKFLRGLDIS